MKPEMVFKRVDQICLVVRDLEKTIEHYWRTFGIGPWKIFLFEEPLLRKMTIKGKPEKYRMQIAMCQMENITFEVIQPLTGNTIYQEFLEQKGEGLNHLGFFVENLDEALTLCEANEMATIQTGGFQQGGFAYLDTQEKFGTIFELIERSKPPNKPLRIWPDEGTKR